MGYKWKKITISGVLTQNIPNKNILIPKYPIMVETKILVKQIIEMLIIGIIEIIHWVKELRGSIHVGSAK